MRLLLLNGPNLNLLGEREPGVYGSKSLEDICLELQSKAEKENIHMEFFQSNFEGALVERIHSAKGNIQGIIINAGAYTHTSVAIRDALLATTIPYIEVHMSNIYKREQFRHNSYLADKAIGVISGFGPNSYMLAFYAFVSEMNNKT